jgi:(E)-4-hydroxy-3-methylbut-2-enyl-diphosphate synthase
MTKTRTEDVKATVAQIRELAAAGCDLVRCAVPTEAAARALRDIVRRSPIPVIADIHFSHRLALLALDSGVHKIRLNPGNIRRKDSLRAVAAAAREHGVPIRVGANSGSAPEGGGDLATRMVEGVLAQCRLLEDAGFHDLVISLKASDAPTTIRAYRAAAERCEYPFHIGVTAAGPAGTSIVKSSVALGTLLAEGLGDTIRVSVTGSPVDEVQAAIRILHALELRERGVEVISCPTCGRCRVNLLPVVEAVSKALGEALAGKVGARDLTVAVMGCEVNGPGEAREADVGLAVGPGGGWLFAGGEKIRKVREDEFVAAVVAEAGKRWNEAEVRGSRGAGPRARKRKRK